MNKLGLIDSFFADEKEYEKFLTISRKLTIANNEATCMAELKVENGYLSYELMWTKDWKFIGDYIKIFESNIENIIKFNEGCRILAERLSIYIETGDVNNVPESPPAFGHLTMKLDGDEFEQGIGEFGHEVSNPIPVDTIYGSTKYLNQLRTTDGEKIEYQRIGSTQAPNIVSMIDSYKIKVRGKEIATLYICPYNKKDSEKAPIGFKLIP